MLGERLGPVGNSKGKEQRHIQDESQQQGVPQWKKGFLQKPSISVRKGIAWVSLR